MKKAQRNPDGSFVKTKAGTRAKRKVWTLNETEMRMEDLDV